MNYSKETIKPNFINGILIDPFNKKVTTVKVDTTNTLKSMYELIGCSMVEVVGLIKPSDNIISEDGYIVEDIWVDEEGLMKPRGEQRFFKISNLPYEHHGVIAGRGLILQSDNEGGTTSTSLSIEEILPRISWDFTHNHMIYSSKTGLFTELKVQAKLYDPNKSIIDSIKSVEVID